MMVLPLAPRGVFENIQFFLSIINGLIERELEIMLSKGLGQYIDPYTKNQIIFENGKLLADILIEVMNLYSINR